MGSPQVFRQALSKPVLVAPPTLIIVGPKVEAPCRIEATLLMRFIVGIMAPLGGRIVAATRTLRPVISAPAKASAASLQAAIKGTT